MGEIIRNLLIVVIGIPAAFVGAVVFMEIFHDRIFHGSNARTIYPALKVDVTKRGHPDYITPGATTFFLKSNKILERDGAENKIHENCQIFDIDNWECKETLYEIAHRTFGFSGGNYAETWNPKQTARVRYMSRTGYAILKCRWYWVEDDPLWFWIDCPLHLLFLK